MEKIENNSEKISQKNILALNNYIGHRRVRTRLVLEGILAGLAAAMMTVAYRFAIDQAEKIRHDVLSLVQDNQAFLPLWLLFLGLGGLVIAWAIRLEPLSSGSGIPQVKGMLLGLIDVSWFKVVLAKFIGGVVAIVGGLSLGREGPSIQLGSSAALGLGRLFHQEKKEAKLLLTCGASAGLATSFNAPLAGLIFSLEEMHKNFSSIILISTLAACVAADFVSKQFFGLAPVLDFSGIQVLPLAYYLWLLPLGLLCGLLGLVFNNGLVKCQDLMQKPKMPFWALPVLVMIFAGGLGLFLPEVLGGGHHLIMDLIKPQAVGYLFLLLVVKYVLTMVSYGSNAPGGIFLPLLALGALTGSLFGQILVTQLGLPEYLVKNFMILAMAGTFTAIVRAPVTGIVLIVEMTGTFKVLLPVLTVCLVAFITAELFGVAPIYDTLLHRLLTKMKKRNLPVGSKKEIIEIPVYAYSSIEGKMLKDIELPKDSLIINISRGEENITPKGHFRFQMGDILAVLCNQNRQFEVRSYYEGLACDDNK